MSKRREPQPETGIGPLRDSAASGARRGSGAGGAGSSGGGGRAGEGGMVDATTLAATPAHRRRYKPRLQYKGQVKVKLLEEDQEPSSGSETGSDLVVTSEQRVFDASRARGRSEAPSSGSSSSTSSGLSSTGSIGSDIFQFRTDLDQYQCKMRVFSESLQLCRCIAADFKKKMAIMDRRLGRLERRQKHNLKQNNYTAIIQKNKELSDKTQHYVAKLQKCGTEAEMREVAHRICRNYLPGLWKLTEPHEIQFRKITGGLSNFIYMVGLPEDLRPLFEKLDAMDDVSKEVCAAGVGDEPRKVLIRIYGQVHGERAMDAIVTESVIFTLLSERRLGPKLFGVFSGGRIEEYIPARSLRTEELADPSISMKIAEKTAAIHSMNIPLSKEGSFLWKTMGKWLRTVQEEVFANGIQGKNEVERACIARLRAVPFAAEIEWLRAHVAALDSPVVFCHNDLQEGNILLLEQDEEAAPDELFDGFDATRYRRGSTMATEPSLTTEAELPPAASAPAVTAQARVPADGEDADDSSSHHSAAGEPKLYLIDFEYCAYNYRGFDIANHFAEWAFDYTHDTHPFYRHSPAAAPSLQQQEIFIREYLKHAATLAGEADPAPHIDAVNKLLAEVEAFSLASHLLWTLWSIVNASKSQIPFGYWEYGVSRLECYEALKAEAVKADKFALPAKRKIHEVDI